MCKGHKYKQENRYNEELEACFLFKSDCFAKLQCPRVGLSATCPQLSGEPLSSSSEYLRQGIVKEQQLCGGHRGQLMTDSQRVPTGGVCSGGAAAKQSDVKASMRMQNKSGLLLNRV